MLSALLYYLLFRLVFRSLFSRWIKKKLLKWNIGHWNFFVALKIFWFASFQWLMCWPSRPRSLKYSRGILITKRFWTKGNVIRRVLFDLQEFLSCFLCVSLLYISRYIERSAAHLQSGHISNLCRCSSHNSRIHCEWCMTMLDEALLGSVGLGVRSRDCRENARDEWLNAPNRHLFNGCDGNDERFGCYDCHGEHSSILNLIIALRLYSFYHLDLREVEKLVN